ncbi:MAG: hypothetical protein AAFQ83_02695 [Bacteroidota bacterium]
MGNRLDEAVWPEGHPSFILLDDQGNIVSPNIERPSDPKLKKRLQALKL